MQQIHPETEVITIPNVGHAPPLLDLATHEKINQWLEAD